MIDPLTRFAALSDRNTWRPVLGFLAFGAVLQGIGFAAVVPLLDGLLGEAGEIAWGWVAVLAVVAVAHAILHYRSVPLGNELGADLVVELTRRVEACLASAPDRVLDPERADRLSSLSGYAIVVLMGLPSHVLRPLVAAVVTPITVVAILLFVQPWAALVLAVGTLVVAAVTLVALRLLVGVDDHDGSVRFDHARVGATAPPSGSSRLAGGDVLPWRSMELLNCAAVVTCVLLALGGGISPAMSVGLIVLSVLMVRPMMEAALLISTVLNSYEVLERVEPLLDEPAHTGEAWPSDHTVEFTDVQVIDGGTALSFRWDPGTTVGVIGASDGPRLTLADLLTGDTSPGTGTVRIGGIEATDLSRAEVAARIARVSADTEDLTVDEARRLIGSMPAAPAPVQGETDLLREAVDSGADLTETDLWRLALLKARVLDPALVIVDATSGSAALGDPGIRNLLSDVTRERTCLLLWGPGSAPPEHDRVLTVDYVGTESR
ncbi:hypothetical protein [Nocardiopsis alba]|uniref:hypothetical protein n=1 Tax=Nocardiopsis alba TaxID=53437 RepID=UPI00363C1BF2